MKRFLSTHCYDWHPDWRAEVDMVDRRTMTRAALFRRLVTSVNRYEGMILNGSIGLSERYVDLLAAIAVRRGRRVPPAIVLTDCSWQLGALWVDRASSRAGIRALDGPRVRYCVRSSDELELFPRTWGVDPAHVVFTPYGHTATPDELATPSTRSGPVFAGGNSLRDYDTLLEAARELPVRFHLETNQISPKAPLPPNVTVSRIRSHDAFVEAMKRASAVVAPLEPRIHRPAGLDTYLTAMAFGKAVIVTESPGVRDYLEHGRTGLVVAPADPHALRDALAWVVDPSNAEAVEAMSTRAAEVARTRFTFHAYAGAVLRVADALARSS